jgi:DnaJ-class molecular chaperone
MQPRTPSPLYDYYRVLGVSEEADAEALKRVYRSAARDCHPDRHPDDAEAVERFKRLQEAYAVLSDPERRRLYDAYRRFEGLSFSGDLASEPLAGGLRQRDGWSEGGADQRALVSISFEEALQGGFDEVRNGAGATIRVTVPRGCPDGLTVRIRGGARAEGSPQHGEDLYVIFKVRSHPRFRREGCHLHVVERITAVEAMLGTTRSIANAYGRRIRVPIPAGTQPGERFRLRGQGVVTVRGAGDLFVEIDVEVPRELSDAQRSQLRRAAQELGLL